MEEEVRKSGRKRQVLTSIHALEDDVNSSFSSQGRLGCQSNCS